MLLMIADGFLNFMLPSEITEKRKKIVSKLKYQNAIACCIILT